MSVLAVLGAGMQGVAAAADAAKYGQFERIVLADVDVVRAIHGSDRADRFAGSQVCEALRLDASDPAQLAAILSEADIAIAALPYKMHSFAEQIALGVGCSVVDMGQDEDTACAIHERSKDAESKGISIVTDCGLAPGLVNVFAADLLARNPGASHIRSYCGGLPERPVGPLGYVLRFSFESVIAEYADPSLALRRGRIEMVPGLEALEEIEFEGLGVLEAFATSGGSGTAPYTFLGQVPNFEYKTLRYPGHCQAMRLFKACGFWDEDRLDSIGMSPREAFTQIMEAQLTRSEIPDVVALRVEAVTADGVARIEMLEHQDSVSGFTAMERLTGFATSIVAIDVAEGRIEPGCRGCESAVDAIRLKSEMERRGFQIRESAAGIGVPA